MSLEEMAARAGRPIAAPEPEIAPTEQAMKPVLRAELSVSEGAALLALKSSHEAAHEAFNHAYRLFQTQLKELNDENKEIWERIHAKYNLNPEVNYQVTGSTESQRLAIIELVPDEG
jgi:hypothetical protein